MAYFAQLDENNKVTQVLVTDDNDPNGDKGYQWLLDNFGGQWLETFYDGSERKNFAGIDYLYDDKLNAFIPPKPFNSWVLDKTTAQWKAPVDYPSDDNKYYWSEIDKNWVLIDAETL